MADGSQTGSRDALLIVALQDLWQARCVVRESMDAIAIATTDSETRAVFEDIHTAAIDEQKALLALASDPGDTPNLWAGGIFDDACRDVATTAQGPVRDIALIGAIRKLLAADIVSLETAIQLAAPRGSACVDPIIGLQTAAWRRDRCLLARLQALTRDSR